MGNYSKLFKNKNFFFLWLGQFISALGDRFTQMSLLAIVMIVSQDTGQKMAWITFYTLLPFLIFGQFFGALSDRLSRKKIMITADILRAALVIFIPFVNKYTNSFSYICLIVFCVGSLSALFSPCKMAIIPNVVKKERLISANSLIASTGMISTLIGTLIAGYLIKWFSPNPSFYLDSITFIVSAVMISNITLRTLVKAEKKITSKGIFEDIKMAFNFMNRHQLILRIVQLSAAYSFLSSFFYITIISYGSSYLNLSVERYGILLASLGIGLSFGAVLLGKKVGRLNYNRILLTGFTLISIVNFIFITKPNFMLSIILLIIGGGGASLVMITLDSLLQRSSPDYLRAKIFSARGIVNNAVFLISLLLVGKLINQFSALTVFGLMWLVSFSVAFLIFFAEGPLGYRILRAIVKLILRVFFQLKISGLDNLPHGGRVILAGNHTSLLDGLIVMAAYPKRIYFLVAESVFKDKFLGFVMRQLGFIPIKKETLNVDAIKEAIRILESGNAVGIFPEGKITEDEQLAKGRKGVAVIAMKVAAPVIPFAIEGAYYAWPLFRKLPKLHPVEIRFGKPLQIRDYVIPEDLKEEVMQKIKEIKIDAEKEGLLEVDPNVIVRHLINFE